MKRSGNYAKARVILEQVVAWLDENIPSGEKKPPWYHEQLGIVLRRLGESAEAKRRTAEADQIVIYNFILHIQDVYNLPVEIRMRYFPNGPVITKNILDSAKRLHKTRPDLFEPSGQLHKSISLLPYHD